MSEPSSHNGSDWRAGHSDLSVMHVQNGFIILSFFFLFREHRVHTYPMATMNELCYCTARTCFKTALLLIERQKNTQKNTQYSMLNETFPKPAACLRNQLELIIFVVTQSKHH